MKLFETWDELKNTLIDESELRGASNIAYFVSNTVRKQCLLGEDQGIIKLRGSTYRMKFIEFGGGVWQATVGL